MVWDDPEAIIPIDFNFEVFGHAVSGMDLAAGLGAGLAPVLVGSSEPTPLLFVTDSDLIDRGYIEEESHSNIVYLTEGEPGSRILKIEWQNAGFYNELNETGQSNDFINLQLWLFEGSNNIEYHYGPTAIEDNSLVHEFINGPVVGMFDFFQEEPVDFGTLFFLSGMPEAPEISQINTPEEINDLIANILNGNPAEGQVYRFSPATTTSQESRTLAARIQVFPQPARDAIQIEYIGQENTAPWEFQVFNLTGSAVLPATIVSGNRAEASLSGLPAGLYVIKIRNAQQQITLKKVIKAD